MLAKLNNNAVPQNAGVVTLIAIWMVLILSYFFSQSMLYITLLLISGFTGATAWISLCWAQINFRRRLYKAGYTTKDLLYKTPGSPYTGIVAIILMVCSLVFLILHNDISYQIAFFFSTTCLVIPILLYKILKLEKNRRVIMQKNGALQFADIFPEK